jgi:gamma-glutamyl AIG2-like cyclotransferase
MTQLLFAYGSLVDELGGRPAVLRDHRCGWGVAMDNRQTIPGYKVYIDPDTGEQPAVYVAFVCIWPEPGATVDGVVVEIEDLAALDRRERNYDRCDVSAHLDGDGPVWAYVASAGGRERFAAGCAAGTVVVSQDYAERVPGGPPDLPVRRLLRRDVGA